MTAQEKRMGADRVQEQIEALILSATEPKDKAFLLIMNKIAISLDTNTYLTQGLSDEFKAHTVSFKRHEEAEASLLNRGRGGILVGLYLLGIIQAMAGYIIYNQIAEIRELKQDVQKAQNLAIIHTEQLKALVPRSSP